MSLSLHRVDLVSSRIAEFARATSGSVLMIFGMITMVLFMLVGAAVDTGRWLNARDHTISAIDAAVLAAGRALQTNGGDVQAALQIAQSYYNEATKSRLSTVSDTVTFKVVDDGLTVTATGNARVATPFMAIAGIESLALLRDAEGVSGSDSSDMPSARIAAGSNAKMNVETAVMLDVSGSMAGQKLTDLKTAASDLVNIIVWQQQSQYTSRVALVPFSADVRPPENFLSSIVPAGARFTRTGTVFGQTRTYYFAPTVCVAERGGTNAYTDAPPLGDNQLTRVHRQVSSSSTTSASCATAATAEVMPLTNNKSALIERIESLTASGGTAGHIGTAWAYYMLSPQWASVLPSDSRPSSYRVPSVKKIAVLMTDGEYNFTYHPDSAPTSSPGVVNSASGSINGRTSAQQAIEICSRMKSDDIEIYTVGFDLGGNQTAINTLRACATDLSKAYTADNGQELKNAFRDIALQISSLYLAK